MNIKDQNQPVKIFCCYARKDQPLLMELKNHLKLWERQQLITLWTDMNVDPGANWRNEISRHLDSAHIILLLVSPDFLASEYCYSTEMTHAMKRYECGDVSVIPIILRPCVWEDAPFGELQALPTDAIPVISPGRHTLDEALTDVVRSLRKVITHAASKSRAGQGHSLALIEEFHSQGRDADRGTQPSAFYLAAEEQLGTDQEQHSPMLSSTVLATASRESIMSASTNELPQPIIPVTQLIPTQYVVCSIRLLVFWIVLVLYWLLIGYTTPSIFPDKILRISGSTYLAMLLQGNSQKMQILKILVVLFSLTTDWFLVGVILSRIPHPSLFTLQDALVYGPILVAVGLFLLTGYIILYFFVRWPYTNVINLRKIIEVTFVTALLIFVSKAFSADFLYFPIIASTVSLFLFVAGIVSLGGTPSNDEPQGFTEILEKNRKMQKKYNDQSKAYFDNRKAKNIR